MKKVVSIRHTGLSFVFLGITIAAVLVINYTVLPAWRNYCIIKGIERTQNTFLQHYPNSLASIQSSLSKNFPQAFTVSYYYENNQNPQRITQITFSTSTLSVYTLNERGKQRLHIDPLYQKTREKLYTFIRTLQLDNVVLEQKSTAKKNAPNSRTNLTVHTDDPYRPINIYTDNSIQLEKSWQPEWQAMQQTISQILKIYQ